MGGQGQDEKGDGPKNRNIFKAICVQNQAAFSG